MAAISPITKQPYYRKLFHECVLLIDFKVTRERYARALERFLGTYPSKTYAHQLLRPTIYDYVETRLGEGASVATVRLELSSIRGLFRFMMDIGAADLMFNPVIGVRVQKRSKGKSTTGPIH